MFKPKFLVQTDKAENLKKEIIQMMSGCDDKMLTKYRNILFVLNE